MLVSAVCVCGTATVTLVVAFAWISDGEKEKKETMGGTWFASERLYINAEKGTFRTKLWVAVSSVTLTFPVNTSPSLSHTAPQKKSAPKRPSQQA